MNAKDITHIKIEIEDKDGNIKKYDGKMKNGCVYFKAFDWFVGAVKTEGEWKNQKKK